MPTPASPSRSEDDAAFVAVRRTTLLAVMFCYLFYYTGRQSFGFAIPGMEHDLGLTKQQLGWCGAAMLWAYALGQAVNGQLADRFGGKKMMVAGAWFSFALNVVLSFAGGLVGVMVPWALNGAAQSMGWAPGSRILSNWWDKRHRGLAFGWYLFAAGSSSVLTFGLSALVLEHFGWRWIFRLPVIMLLVGSVVFWFVAKEKPEDIGHKMPADEGVVVENEAEADAAHANLTTWQRYKTGLTCVPFMFGCLSIGFQNLARYCLLIWVPVHLLGKDWDKAGGAGKWMALALPIGMALGAVSAGFVSDRVFKGKRSAAIIIFLFLGAICAGVLSQLPRESALCIPLLFLAGFLIYGPQSGYWALCPDLLGRRLAGTGTGMMNFFAYLFAGLGEPLTGKLIEHTGHTSVAFVVVGAACVAGSGLMLLVRR